MWSQISRACKPCSLPPKCSIGLVFHYLQFLRRVISTGVGLGGEGKYLGEGLGDRAPQALQKEVRSKWHRVLHGSIPRKGTLRTDVTSCLAAPVSPCHPLVICRCVFYNCSLGSSKWQSIRAGSTLYFSLTPPGLWRTQGSEELPSSRITDVAGFLRKGSRLSIKIKQCLVFVQETFFSFSFNNPRHYLL